MPERGYIVTGATGFLGSALLRALAPVEMVALTRPETDLSALPPGVCAVPISDFLSWVEALPDPGRWALIHCAALAGRDDSETTVARELEANFAQPMRLFETALRAGIVRAVNFGSFWEHDASGRLAPFNRYAFLKTAFQNYLDFAATREGLAATTLKLCETYGPGDRRQKLLNLLLKASREGAPLDLTDGLQRTSFLHVDDICRAVSIALDWLYEDAAALQPGHHVYHLNSGRLLSIRDFAETLCSVVPEDRRPLLNWGAVPRREGLPETAWIDGPRLPGWQPAVSLEDGLRDCVRAALPGA